MQPLFNEVGHEATHRSAGGRYSLKQAGAIGIGDKRTLNGGYLSVNTPKACGDALITFVAVLVNRLLH
jgi:hypothetical protein